MNANTDYQANKERILKQLQQYYIENKDRVQRKYIENRESILERIKAYNQLHKEERRQYHQKYYLFILRERRKQKLWGDPDSEPMFKPGERARLKFNDKTLYINDIKPLAIIKPYKLPTKTSSPIEVKFKQVIIFD
mgnify:CR=1 FL=1